MGVVDTMMISESVDEKIIDEFMTEAENLGSNVEIISLETREGAQLKDLGGYAAILRYDVGDQA